MSKDKKPSALAMAFKYIWTRDKTAIFVEIVMGLLLALLPMINIFIPAKIIGILSTTKDTVWLVTYSAIAIFGNAILLIATKMLKELQRKHARLLYMHESSDLCTKVFKVEYPNLENAKFEGDVNKYKLQGKSPYMTLLWVINSFVSGLASLALSLAMISPFFKVVFKTTGVGFLHSPWYGVMIIGVVLAVAVLVLVVSSKVNKKWYKISNEFATYNRMFSFFQERLNDYNSGKDVRLYGEQNLIFDSAMKTVLNEGVTVYNKMHTLQAKQSGLIAVVGALVGFGIYSIIGLKSLAGFMTVESLVLCVGGMMQVVAGITNLGSVTGTLSSVIPLVRDFDEIMSVQDEVDSGLEFNGNFKSLGVNDLSFKYGVDLPLSLDKISFDIQRGDKVALVGQNGSGKSTLIKLLCGLYPSTNGSIMVDGMKVDCYNSKAWKDLFSVVFQDCTVFSQTLAFNVTGSKEYDSAKLEKCLEQVGILDKVKNMPNGYDSYLYKHYDDSGIEISGGEAQRIAMARALYKDAPIMILDEPTAALDPFAEQEIYNRFNELTADKTVFYISHRLSSCYFCNKIVVFDQGKLVQMGSHSDLLKDKDGKYFELWNAQAKYYVNE